MSRVQRPSLASTHRLLAILIITVSLLALGVSPSLSVKGAIPSSGTITTTSRTISWTGSTPTTNPTLGAATSFDPSTCQTLGYCDLFNLNLQIPANLSSTSPGYFLNITMTWANSNYDYDLYVYLNGNQVAASLLGPTGNFEGVLLRQPPSGLYQVYASSFSTPPNTPYFDNATLGLVPPASWLFNQRGATYIDQTSGKASGSPFTFTPDNRLTGASCSSISLIATCTGDAEPSIRFDKLGTTYVTATRGGGGGVDLWSSSNGGASFQYLGEADGPPSQVTSQQFAGIGGGDDDLAIGNPFVLLNQSSSQLLNSTGRLYVSSLTGVGEPLSVTVATSINQGKNFVLSQTDAPVDDRQWTVAEGSSTYYITFNEIVSQVAGITNLVLLESTDGGLTFTKGAFIGKALSSNLSQFQGPLALAPDGTIYNVYVPPSTNQIVLAKCPAPCNLPSLTSATSSTPIQASTIFKGPSWMTTDNVFPQVAVDTAGNVYVSWSDGASIYLISSSDGGVTWTLPVTVNNGPETATALEPWLQAGDPGRVGLMWYGTNTKSSFGPDDFSTFANAQWKVYYSFTANALASSPTFTQVAVSGGSDLPNGVAHVGAICTMGTACPSGTRNLAEYSSFTVSPDGTASIIFATDLNTTGNNQDQVDYVRETAGPDFFAPSLGRALGHGIITPNQANDHFSFRVDSTSNGLTGRLHYLDQTIGLLVESTNIASFSINGNQASLTGLATFTNGGSQSIPVTFNVNVLGNQGENSGKNYFAISLSNGYSAAGSVSQGNIQVLSQQQTG